MQIITSKDHWTPVTVSMSARIWDNKIWKKETGPQYFGGYHIKYASLNSRIGREWLISFGHYNSCCNQEVVDIVDPIGDLRRNGLLTINK
jgi:hypothetical protein